MTEIRFDIIGIGNAMVDVTTRIEDTFLSRHDMHKGAMILVDAAAAETLYAAMPPGIESSGGSAGNTCAVAAALGARVAYLGKVADDQLGDVFAHDLDALGVHFPSARLTNGVPTARCLILVTPDGQRTMNTYLGACVTFGEADVDEDLVAAASVTYLEGYLFDPPAAQAAFRRAAAAAHRAGRQVALSLSDAFCVDRHRAAFRDLVSGHVDILFANETEITSLYEKNTFRGSRRGGPRRRGPGGADPVRGRQRHFARFRDRNDRRRAGQGRRYHRRRRCLCRRVPGRLDRGPAAAGVRPHGQPGGGRGDQPLRCPPGGGPAGAGGARVGVGGEPAQWTAVIDAIMPVRTFA